MKLRRLLNPNISTLQLENLTVFIRQWMGVVWIKFGSNCLCNLWVLKFHWDIFFFTFEISFSIIRDESSLLRIFDEPFPHQSNSNSNGKPNKNREWKTGIPLWWKIALMCHCNNKNKAQYAYILYSYTYIHIYIFYILYKSIYIHI